MTSSGEVTHHQQELREAYGRRPVVVEPDLTLPDKYGWGRKRKVGDAEKGKIMITNSQVIVVE
jgi:hypothetical protein